jgi:hypothetical protein
MMTGIIRPLWQAIGYEEEPRIVMARRLEEKPD